MKTSMEPATAGGHGAAFESDNHSAPRGRIGFSEQIPTVVLTAAIIVGATAWMRYHDELKRIEYVKLLTLQNEALRAQADDNRRHVEATTRLLKDAVARRDGEVVRPEEELGKLNQERMNQLAEAIARKVTPALPAPRKAEEVEQMQAEQLDKVAGRFTENLRPMLSEFTTQAANQSAASAQVIRQYDARVQELNHNLQVVQTAAQDALKLTHEVSALYLDSFKDQGVLMRLFSLPANLVIDAASLNLVTNRDRAKVRQELSEKMNEIDQRLQSIRTAAIADKS